MSRRYSTERGYCASCDKERALYDVFAYDGVSKFCYDCIKEYGAKTLQASANAALAMREVKSAVKKCFRCSAPLIEGVSSPMCNECNGKYEAMFGKKVKWG